jgi:hypothetical protein
VKTEKELEEENYIDDQKRCDGNMEIDLADIDELIAQQGRGGPRPGTWLAELEVKNSRLNLAG